MPSTPSAPVSAVVGSVATNTVASLATTFAPALPSNTMGVGGPEVELLAQFLGALAQIPKMWSFFHQSTWLPVCIILTSLALGAIIWHDEIQKMILNSGAAAFRSLQTYGTLSKMGVLSAGTD